MSNVASSLGDAYRKLYVRLCGPDTKPLPWHFQWLSAYYLRRQLSTALPDLKGTVLDVGCGDKPYSAWLSSADHHIGIDVYPGPRVDHVVQPNTPWPQGDASCDAILATQVLEHVSDLDHTLKEMRRTLRPGGTVIATVPFLFNEHGAPHDYRRFTRFGAADWFPGWQMVRCVPQGGIGSTLATLLLNWVDTALNGSKPLRLLKALLLPLWIPFSLATNLAALVLDQLDRTDAFYSNLMVEFKAPAPTS